MKKLLVFFTFTLFICQIAYSADCTTFTPVVSCRVDSDGPKALILMSADRKSRVLSRVAADSVPVLKRKSTNSSSGTTLTLQGIRTKKELDCLYEYIIQRYNDKKFLAQKEEGRILQVSQMDKDPEAEWIKYCQSNKITTDEMLPVLKMAMILFDDEIIPKWMFSSLMATMTTEEEKKRFFDRTKIRCSKDKSKPEDPDKFKTMIFFEDQVLVGDASNIFRFFYNKDTGIFGDPEEISKCLPTLLVNDIFVDQKSNKLCIFFQNFNTTSDGCQVPIGIDCFLYENGKIIKNLGCLYSSNSNNVEFIGFTYDSMYASCLDEKSTGCQILHDEVTEIFNFAKHTQMLADILNIDNKCDSTETYNTQPQSIPNTATKLPNDDQSKKLPSWNDLWTKHVLAKCIALTASVNDDMRKFFVHCASRLAINASREYIKTRTNQMWQKCYNSVVPIVGKVSGFCDEHPFVAIGLMYAFIAYFTPVRDLIPGGPPNDSIIIIGNHNSFNNSPITISR